jgi:hypothetical protein
MLILGLTCERRASLDWTPVHGINKLSTLNVPTDLRPLDRQIALKFLQGFKQTDRQ